MPKFNPSAGCGCCSLTKSSAWTVFHNNIPPELHYYVLIAGTGGPCSGNLEGPMGLVGNSYYYASIFYFDRMEGSQYRFRSCTTNSLFGFSGYFLATKLEDNLTGVYEGNTWIKPFRIDKMVFENYNSLGSTGTFVYDPNQSFVGLTSHYCGHTEYSGSLVPSGETPSSWIVGYAEPWVGYRMTTNTGEYLKIDFTGSGTNIPTISASSVIYSTRGATSYIYPTIGYFGAAGSDFLAQISFPAYSGVCVTSGGWVNPGCPDEYSVACLYPSYINLATKNYRLDYPNIYISGQGYPSQVIDAQCCVCNSGISGSSQLGSDGFLAGLAGDNSYEIFHSVSPASLGGQWDYIMGYHKINCPNMNVPQDCYTGISINPTFSIPFANINSGFTPYYFPGDFTIYASGDSQITGVPDSYYDCNRPSGTPYPYLGARLKIYEEMPGCPNNHYSVVPSLAAIISGRYNGYNKPMIVENPVLAWIELSYRTIYQYTEIRDQITCPIVPPQTEGDIYCLTTEMDSYDKTYYAVYAVTPNSINNNKHIFEPINLNDFVKITNFNNYSTSFTCTYTEEQALCGDDTFYTITSITNYNYEVNEADLSQVSIIESPYAGGSDLCIPE